MKEISQDNECKYNRAGVDSCDKPGNDWESFHASSDDDGLAEKNPVRWSLAFRLVALVTVLTFLSLIGIGTLRSLKTPLPELVLHSLFLQESLDEDLLKAVVQVRVVSRKDGAAIAVEQMSGTGFNIDPSGIIVTNHHIINDALNIYVKFPDKRIFNATNWLSNPDYDLAAVFLDASDLPVLPLDSKSMPHPGDNIKVIGNPLSLHNIVVEGRINHYLQVRNKPERIFSFDAPIFPGNSGSPVIDSKGQVIGVVFGSLPGESEGKPGLGLAVPVNQLFKALDF